MTQGICVNISTLTIQFTSLDIVQIGFVFLLNEQEIIEMK